MVEQRARVMIVDDSPIVRANLSAVLSNAGHHVREAVSGIDALNQIRRELPDLLVTDLNMPEMDGLQLLAKLREEELICPVLVVTTEISSDFKDQGRRLGVKAWIIKPYKPDSLCRAVAALLKSASSSKTE